MIDEKKLIERLHRCVDTSDNSNFTNGLLSAIDIVKQQHKIGEWISCSERLPEEKINPVTNDFYEYQVTFKSDEVTDVRHYKFGRWHWWNCGQNMDKYVIAWQPLPDPYEVKFDE